MNNNSLIESKDDIEEFLMNLMSIDSTTGKEWILGNLLKDFLEDEGFNITIQPLSFDNNRFNILATWAPFIPPGPKILFNTHLDTVPPYIPPTKNEENIFGRGANDAKGQIASQIFAMKKIIKEMPNLAIHLGLLLTVGEEKRHDGMKEANKLGLKPDYLIIGEPIDSKFASLQKGAVSFKLIAKGIAAHSGTPEKGENAINKLLDVLDDLRNYEWPNDLDFGNTTLNIGFIEGGQALNALAAHASASIMFRVTKSSKELLETVKTIVNERVEIEILGLIEPVKVTIPPAPYETQPISGISDAAFFEKHDKLKGIYIYGPGSIESAHSENEFISINDLKNSVNVLFDFVKMLSSNEQ
uniref:Peptidase M20 dimerisation domain-containing protein n=1 Tax=Panagrolaimus sp. PS1159 TaxID=55785 RepID=A0AC35GSX6_9BILA